MKFSLNHFWVFIGFIFFSCLKEPYRAPIYVNTRDANEIKATSVKLHADVQSPDAGEITDRGFYWTANDSAATVLKNKISFYKFSYLGECIVYFSFTMIYIF